MGSALSAILLRSLDERKLRPEVDSQSTAQPLSEPLLSAAPATVITPRTAFDSSTRAAPAGELTPRAVFDQQVIAPLKERAREENQARPLDEPVTSVAPEDDYRALHERLDQAAPSHALYDRSVRNLPTENEYLDLNEHKGIGGRIMSGLRSAGKNLLRSGLNPFVAAGKLVEGIADPRAEARTDYRLDVQPRGLSEQNRLLRQSQTELGMTNVLQDNDRQREQIRSMDANRQAQLQFNMLKERELDENHDLDRQARIHQQDMTAQGRRRKDLIAMDKAGMLTPRQRAELAQISELPGELQEPFVNGQIAIDWDDEGRPRTINKRTNTATSVIDPQTGKAAAPRGEFVQRKEGLGIQRENAATNRGRLGEQQRHNLQTEQGGGKMTAAQAKVQAAQELGADADGNVDNPKWKREYESALPTARIMNPGNEAAAITMAEARADKKAEGRKIAVEKHPNFQGHVNRLAAGSGQGGAAKAKSYSATTIKKLAEANGKSEEKIKRQLQEENPGVKLVFN
ncbi:MAG: hypothetical protein WBV94_21875 [Blastocatellia bacterium]